MRFLSSSITVAIAAATTVSAVFVPHDQPDGNYAVTTDENGQDVHTFVSAISLEKYDGPSATPEGGRYASSGDGVNLMDKRWLEGPNPIYCADKSELNHADTDTANNNIDAMCGVGTYVSALNPGHTLYSIVGDTVAYYCNMASDSGNACYATERQLASSRITDGCGWYITGDDTVAWRQSVYGYQKKGVNFCGRGTTG